MDPTEFELYRNMLDDEDGELTNDQIADLTPNSLREYQAKKSLG